MARHTAKSHKIRKVEILVIQMEIDRNGNVVERFEPTADMDVVEEKIREIL